MCDNLCVTTLVLAWQLWRRRFSPPNLLKVLQVCLADGERN